MSPRRDDPRLDRKEPLQQPPGRFIHEKNPHSDPLPRGEGVGQILALRERVPERAVGFPAEAFGKNETAVRQPPFQRSDYITSNGTPAGGSPDPMSASDGFAEKR